MTIDEIKEKITPVAQTYNIAKLALFGSAARGENTIHSDLDIIVEKGENPMLKGLGFIAFWNSLEEASGKSVDLVTYSSLKRSFLQAYAMKDEVIIYEQ